MATNYRVYYADLLTTFRFETPAKFEPGKYEQVAFVEADDLEDLFRQMNVVDGTEIPVQLKIRSMSAGDVAVDITTEKAYFCALQGWVEVEPTTPV